ncbi:helix-turn-helix domain-containing protein, partial [Dysgonomonas hofstadii]
MKNMERKIRARQNWLRIYEQTGSVTKTALRYGIARTTLYRWIKRYQEEGKSGLSDKSKRPLN